MISIAVVALMAVVVFPADAFLLRERVVLGHLQDPTKSGHMGDMSRSQDWLVNLLNNPKEGEKAAEEHVPYEFHLIKTARQYDPGNRIHTLQACKAIHAKGNMNHANKPYLAAAGGIDMIISALRRFHDDKSVLKECIRALGGGLILYQYDLQEYAGNLGGVELVLDAQRKFKEDPKMQLGGESGCFHDFSHANRERFQKAGGIEYLIETIDRHFDNPEVVLNCWFAFSSGTQTPNERHFVEAGGIPAAIKSMTVHAKYSRVREEAMQSLRAVERCAGCGDLQAQLVQAGLIPILVKAAKDVPMDVHTQSPVCANLAHLTSANDTQRHMAIEEGAVRLAVKAVENFPQMVSSVNWAFDDQYTVYEDCLEALANMVLDFSAVVELRSLNAQDVIQTAMKNKPKQRVKMAGWAILENL